MFVTVLLKDTVAIPPWRFGKEIDAITFAINKKYGDKVIPNVGLCVTLLDIVEVGDAFIYPGEGSSHVVVKFHMVVFRPFRGEVLVGKVRSCSSSGVQISLGFFEDIYISAESLQMPQVFDEEEHAWIWKYEIEGDVHDLVMEVEDEVRFRVQSIQFNPPHKQRTFKPKVPLPAGEGSVPTEHANEDEEASILSPMVILATCNEDGLGPLHWWNSDN